MPIRLKLASYEDLPIEFSRGDFQLPMPWDHSEIPCSECRHFCIKVYGNTICPSCVLDTRFVQKARATLANAKAAYQFQMKEAA
jgi:hypothetical protein